MQATQAQSPVISSLSPSSGEMGTSIIINGTGFTGTTSVRFGEKSASFTVNSNTQITAIVPRGASKQPVNVTNANGYGLSPSAFTVTRASNNLTYSLVANNFGGVSGSTQAAPAIGDLDNDGRLDLLVGRSDGTVIRYEQTAANATTFTNLGSLSEASGTINMGGRVSVCIVDANGDGKFSVLLGRPDGLVYEYEQTAVNATTFSQVTTSFGDVATTTYAVVGMTDFNRDGALEFLTGKGDNFVGYFEQDGVNTIGFSRVESNFLSLTNNTFPFCIDLDGNGLIDVLIGEGGGKMYRFEQSAENTSSLTQITSSFNGIDVGTNAKPCVTDIDGDGLLDMLIGRADGTIDRYEQGASTAPIITGFAATATTVCVGSPVTFTATVGNVTSSYNYTLTNGSSSLTDSTPSTAFSQSLTASGSGLQSFSLLVNDNGSTSFASTTVNVGAHPDYQPLVDLYNATNGPGWGNSTGWLQSCDPCTGNGGGPWYGVTCEGGRVTDLILQLNQLSGTIPASLSTLTNLNFLNLIGNQLIGSIPSGLGSLTNLELLYLSSNQLSGTIPSSLGALTNLQWLLLNSNRLSGSIPSSLGGLTNLQWLDLRGNQLSGCWPASLSALCGINVKNFAGNSRLPGGGSDAAFDAFCASGQGSDAFVAQATPSSTIAALGSVVSLSTSGGSSYSWTAPAGVDLSSPSTTSVVSATLNQTGVQTFTVVVSNGGTCSQTATASVTVSLSTATVITAPSTNVSGTSAVLGGTITADGGASVTERGVVYVVGTGIPTTTDTKVTIGSGLGSFSQSVTGLTNNTIYSVRAYAINAVGTSYGDVQSFTTIAAPLAPQLITPANGSRLSDNSPTYSGTATPGSSVTLFVDGNNVGQITTNAGGNWTFTPVSPLSDNAHSVYARATLDGLDSPNSTTISFTVDTTPPIAPVVTAPLDGTILNDNTPTYGGTAEPSSIVTVLVDGSVSGTALTAGSGNWTYTSGTPLTDGTHTVRARATDDLGNTGPTSITTTFTIDTSQPTITISSSAPNPTNTSPIPLSVTFSESVTGLVAGDININNGTLSGFAGSGTSYTATLTPTTAGLVSVSVSASVAQDAAGNGNQASTVFTIQYLPNATLTGFAATATTVCVGSPVTFTATVGNVTGSYNYTLTNGSISLTSSTTSTAYSQSLTASGSGLQSFTLLVSDNGQSGSAVTPVTINPLPLATILTPASTTLTCSTTSISVTATGGATYQWEDNSTNAIRSLTTANTYSVTVTGSNGCTALATTSIFSNTALSIGAGSSLPQANVGVVVSLTASGATTYQWSVPATTLLTSPATGSAVSVSLTTAGVQTFMVVATTGACSQSALVSVTALAGPDLSATLSLPDANFPAGSSKDLLMQLQEVNGSTARGSIVITLTVPAGYSVSFDNTLSSINVSGGTTNPVAVQNSQWQVSQSVAGQQLSLSLNGGESVVANGTLSLGFTIIRTSANSGSVSNITVNVADDSGGSYDVNRLNNVYARIISGL
ncbi:hypothetical protein GCM10028809_32690 [Spirosoma gilvum]